MNIGKRLVMDLGSKRLLTLVIVAHEKLSSSSKAHINGTIGIKLGFNEVVVIPNGEDGSNNKLGVLGTSIELITLVILTPKRDTSVVLKHTNIVKVRCLHRTIDTGLELTIQRSVVEYRIKQIFVSHVRLPTGVNGLQLLQAHLVGNACTHEPYVMNNHCRAGTILNVERPTQPLHLTTDDGVSFGRLYINGGGEIIIRTVRGSTVKCLPKWVGTKGQGGLDRNLALLQCINKV
mmetsp:Transcript_31625/g.64381  ORF Transcript_31625/g.64381 Transcript_31625/m.64381 type:complete len:234 (+) Transcript_31625:1503-2204(+)